MTKTIAVVLCLILSAAAQTKTAVAVNDLRGHGVTADEAVIITERLRSELIAAKKFRVMERSEMESILKEQGFQQSGACDDGSCMVEVGRLLAVERLVAGSVGHIGDIYTLNVKMIDVQSGEIVASAVIDYEGKISGLLSEGVKDAAVKLSSGASGSTLKKETPPGSVSVNSSPDSAQVKINGTVKGFTPLAGVNTNPGLVKISLSKKGFQTLDTTVSLASMESKVLSLNLQKADLEKRSKIRKIVGFSVGGSLLAGGAAAAVLFNSKLGDKQEEYDALTTKDQGTYPKYHTDMNNLLLYRKISAVTAGIGAAVVTVSFFF